ncbi:hypothetical protein BMS3Abin16_01470 [archaeon BMS3Abin16]|nr:hypothetical protein BMS3Abin16_01470 [archaeon BMS3Abin16]GBE56845.1 hypothetical protein BMS3Bbin16_01058 [archaeon BMS3Bbin16]HDY73777.1 hypothetical protein [Euryarchaeota archaeon]
MKGVLKTLGKNHRIEILNTLEDGPQGIYDVYKVLKEENHSIYTSVIERALKELWTQGLALRDGDKKYHITGYGKYILQSVIDQPNPEVVAYLKEKKIDLPEEFLSDLSHILRKVSIAKELAVMEALFKIQKETRNEVLLILQKPFFSQIVMKNNLDMMKRGVKFRCILHSDNLEAYLDKEQMKGVIDEEILNEHNNAIMLNQGGYDVQTRFLSDIKIHLYLADRKIVSGGFPQIDGNIPVNIGFVNNTPEGVEWGMKVFDYYWQRANQAKQ